MNKAKEIMTYILIFFFFALLTAGTLFFGLEAARCIKHFIDNTEISLMELICLGFVMIAGGFAGFLWAICSDMIEIE